MNNSIETLSNEVCRIAIDTGKYLKKEQAKLSLEDIEFKGPRNYVTYIDKEAEHQLVGALENLLPEAGFLTEEATIEYEQKENTWIIDPLDGTTNYIHGDNPFAVSIALMRKGKIVLGIVYDPVANELYSAIGPGKAYLNDHPIHASSHAQLQNGYIGFGIPYNLTAEGEKILQNTLAQFRKCSFRIKGSAAVEICYVACGRSDAYFHSGLSPWDVAAGTFILECAGGKCTDFAGSKNYLFGKELVAGNGKINQEIMDNIIKHA